jgi:cytochrome c peroxidase
MSRKRIWICASILLLIAAIGSAAALTNDEKLGKEIFFDKDLSKNKNQACASCHAPEVGFTGPFYALLFFISTGSISE